MLVAGTLGRAQWPELDDEDFAGEVRNRLDMVGLELVGAAGKWLARPKHAPTDDVDGFEPAFGLNTVELAVIAPSICICGTCRGMPMAQRMARSRLSLSKSS